MGGDLDGNGEFGIADAVHVAQVWARQATFAWEG